MEKTEQEKFLEQFGEDTSQSDPFNEQIGEQPVTQKVDEDPTGDLTPKNRRERRLAEKLETERKAAIELAERLQKLEQAKETRESPDYIKSIERIYGTETPEAREATELLKHALLNLEESASERAYNRLAEEQRERERAQKEAETQLTSMLEDIEDSYNVDLLENEAVRTSYLKLLEKMSPKDRDGNILEYADHHAVWEVFQTKRADKQQNRAKDLANRTMEGSGTANDTKLQDDVMQRFLRENGIL